MTLVIMHTATLVTLLASNCLWDLGSGHEDFGGARPINPETWVTSADYPEGVTRRTEQGAVRVKFFVSGTGGVENCRVDATSGFTVLDEVPCKLLARRARFAPAKDSLGAPIPVPAVMTFYFAPE